MGAGSPPAPSAPLASELGGGEEAGEVKAAEELEGTGVSKFNQHN